MYQIIFISLPTVTGVSKMTGLFPGFGEIVSTNTGLFSGFGKTVPPFKPRKVKIC